MSSNRNTSPEKPVPKPSEDKREAQRVSKKQRADEKRQEKMLKKVRSYYYTTY
jgi:hypothetical protein